MRTRQGTLRWQTIGLAVVFPAALVAGMAMCWGQQKGNSGFPGAASQMQQQQMAAEQQLMLTAAQASTPAPNPRQPGSSSPFPSAVADDPTSFLQEAVRTKRNDERQKRLESDTRRLLSLASSLKTEVAGSGAESMTPEMLRQMDEIEKLAKSVKDRMRN